MISAELKRKAVRKIGHQKMVIQQQAAQIELLRADHGMLERMVHEIFEENLRYRARFAHLLQFEDLPVNFGYIDGLFTTQSEIDSEETETELEEIEDEDALRERLREEAEFDGF